MNKHGLNYSHFDVLSRLNLLLRERGWSRYRLAKEADLSTTTINNLWQRNNAPTSATLEDICRALGITMAEFFTLPADVPSVLTLEQRTLLSRWDMLTAEQRAAFLLLMQGCSENADT